MHRRQRKGSTAIRTSTSEEAATAERQAPYEGRDDSNERYGR